MGANTSNNYSIENNTCLICWDQIKLIDLIVCFRCNILLHAHCEETYRDTRRFCKCPHCQGIGTLVIGSNR